jgi:hypothetical protein
MEKETLKKIFEFLEENGEHNAPILWKLKNNIPLTDEDLIVKGNLDLSYTNITSLPEGLRVDGNLNLIGLDIKSLPEGLKVDGNLDLNGCKNIELLPDGLKVGGWLDLENTSITALPKGLKIHGDLYRKNTELEKYSDYELHNMIKPGYIQGKIYR